MKQIVRLNVNGEEYEVAVEPSWTLLDALRNGLSLIGTKQGCDQSGECGACTVLMNGFPIYSCLILAVDAQGQKILTIEGLNKNGRLHPIQESFIQHGAIQCGYCTPGMVLTAKALLDVNPKPTESEVRQAISGNICRCTGYVKIVKAIMIAAEAMAKENDLHE